MSNATSFSLLTRFLHWLIAAHMIGLIALGWWMIDLSFYSSWYYTAPYLHKAFGVLVLVLGLLLLVERAVRGRPAPLSNHTKLEKLASRIAHLLLLAAVLIIPVTGYIFTTSKGEGVSFFDLFTIPALFDVSDGLRDAAIDVHYYASYGLIVVIMLHAAGALKHHFIDKDRTLRRMTF
ncbi:MAG: cytochrome b [Pseudomonadota bacterium]